MTAIRTVLTPVDFSPATEIALARSVEICRELGAALVLHHHEQAPSPGLTRVWDWEERQVAHGHETVSSETELRKLLATVPPEIDTLAEISRGALVPALGGLVRSLPVDLIVLVSHGETSDDHTSIADRLLDSPPCSLLVLSDTMPPDVPLLREQDGPASVLVPTDFSPAATEAARHAFELSRRLPLHLDLLHVLGPWSGAPRRLAHPAHLPLEEAPEDELTVALRRLMEEVPEDRLDRTTCHVETGDAVAGILAVSERVHARLVVMGAHTRNLFRRWLTEDTTQGVVHRSPCPVWYVPAA